MTHRQVMTIAAGAIVAGSLLWPADAAAQRRRSTHRAPVRSAVVVGVGFGTPFYPSYYRPWFYDPWLPYGYPYGWFPPYGYARPYEVGSLKLQVEPKETEVYVDGYLAGRADDFDGFFKRLRVEPGEHEVQLYLDGYRPVRQKIYVQPGGTFRLRYAMVPLAAGETPEPRPVPPPEPPGGAPPRAYDAFGRGRGEPPERPGRPERREPPVPPERGEESSFGTLAIRVQPSGAEVIVDGESWAGSGPSDRLVIQLPEGEHRVEIRKEGFSAFTTTVRVRPGETSTLNISLARE